MRTFVLFLLFACIACHLYAQTCPTYDPDLPPNPPSQLNFDIDLRQNYGAGSKAFTLVFKNFPIYNKAGYFITKNALDNKRTLAQQVSANNVDIQTSCSISATDRTIVCADYARQFSNSNYRVSKSGCNLNIEIDLTFDQYKQIATLNSATGTYDLHLNIGYYTKANIAGDVYWSQSSLARFSVKYQEFASQTDKPYAFTGSLSGKTLWKNSKCYAGYSSSLQSSMNDTLFVNYLELNVKDQGKMSDFTGSIDHSLICSKKPNDLSTITCEGYVSMRSDNMELSIANGGRYCALNPQKTACVEEITFKTYPLQIESKCTAEGKTEIIANSYPTLYLSDPADLNKKKVISSIGDTFMILPINAPRASFKASNVKFVFKSKGVVKDLIGQGRAVVIEDPTTKETPSDYADKVCILIKLVDKRDGYFLMAERPIEMSVSWDLIPRVAARSGEIAIDSSFSALMLPEYTPVEKSSAVKVTFGIFAVVLMFLNFF